MRVVFIATPIMDWVSGKLIPIAMDARRQCPPYGLYLLAGVLREEGHDIAIIDLIAQGSADLSPHRSLIDAAGAVCISATSMSWPAAYRTAATIRQWREDVPIIAGGIHPTMFDSHVIRSSAVTHVIRGEGELALPLLIAALERGSGIEAVPNLTTTDANGDLTRLPAAPKITATAMAKMALPAFDLLPMRAYAGLSLESSRGCAFDCSFCSTSYRRTYRGVAPEMFVDRLQAVQGFSNRTRGDTIYIVDDEFSLNSNRATAIADEIGRRGLTPRLIFDSRANEIMRDGYMEAMAPYAHRLLIGAECGYDAGLEKIGKGTTCTLLTSAAERLAGLGLAERVDFSFILGLPWEGREEVEKTVRFALNLHARFGVRVLLQWYCQIPGSRLWDAARADGSVSEAMYDDFGFFRDLYLFRSAVRLSSEDIYEISELILPIARLAEAAYGEQGHIEYAFPEPIARFFPPHLRKSQDGLTNLREVAGGAINMRDVPVGHSLRHLN